MQFSNLKIITKIYIICLVSFFLMACLTLNQVWSSSRIEMATKAVARERTILTGVQQAEFDFSAMRFAAAEIANDRTETELEANEAYIHDLSQSAWSALETPIKIALVPDVLEQVRQYIRSYEEHTHQSDEIESTLVGNIEGSKGPDQTQATANLAASAAVADQLAQEVQIYVLRSRKNAEFFTHNAMTAQQNALNQARDVSFGLLGLFAACLLFAAFILYSSIAKPVRTMTGVMRRLAEGDAEVEIGFSGRRDEIGAMAAAVRVSKDNASARGRLQAEAAEFQADLDRKLRETERAFEAASREQSSVVLGITASLAKLADGDLTVRFTSEVTASYAALKSDFNRATENLMTTMRLVRMTIDRVRTGTAEIKRASDDLTRRSEHQAATLEQSAAALDGITVTVRKTAEVVNEARTLSASAREDAEQSSHVVQETVSAMTAIEGSSKQIGNIIGVIDEIAFQTNLLALNAGVEAARAGDAGRGFAVVATEVRALAQRSADAAKQIKALISDSAQQVEVGVKLVGDTGRSLDRIGGRVKQLSGVMTTIAASTQEQSTGLAEVNSAVNQMDQVTQENAAMVEQAAAASHSLASEANELAKLVEAFNIGPAMAAEAEEPRARSPSRARMQVKERAV